jgi:hypothetical protein
VDLEQRETENYGPSTLKTVHKDIQGHLHWFTTLNNCSCLEVEMAGSSVVAGQGSSPLKVAGYQHVVAPSNPAH